MQQFDFKESDILYVSFIITINVLDIS